MQQPGEPSVEEILDSIKKVIARDNRAGAMEARRRRERTTRDESPSSPHDPVMEEEADEVLDLAEAELVDEDESESPAESDDDQDSEGPSLMSEAARHAMRDNLATLALLSEPGSPPQIVRSGETSLEGMAREMLRPMLAQWLDDNLPGMVEDLVKAEIARIAGKRS